MANHVIDKQKQIEAINKKSISLKGYSLIKSIKLCLNKYIATKKKGI